MRTLPRIASIPKDLRDIVAAEMMSTRSRSKLVRDPDQAAASTSFLEPACATLYVRSDLVSIELALAGNDCVELAASRSTRLHASQASYTDLVFKDYRVQLYKYDTG